MKKDGLENNIEPYCEDYCLCKIEKKAKPMIN